MHLRRLAWHLTLLLPQDSLLMLRYLVSASDETDVKSWIR